jgi:hypothetical protein
MKEKAATGMMAAADKGANLVAKASGLSSEQLQNIEAKRNKFMSEKPDTDPEGIKRLLGSYAIEAFEAYLPQISYLYNPIPIEVGNDEKSLINRIRYFEITKWVTDPTEDSLEKLINVYQVVSRENCNIALIYNRKVEGCKVYLSIVSTDPKDTPQIVDALEDRIVSAVRGNFPGAEFKQREKNLNGENRYGLGVLPCLEETESFTVAAVSNIATEKSEDFLNQSMEKLLDGICPDEESEEYTIVLLATPIMEQLERKNELSELYSKLAPYASWETNFTYTEMAEEGSSATFGATLGATAGRQTDNAYTDGKSYSHSDSLEEGTTHTEERTVINTDTIGGGISGGVSAGGEAGIPFVAKGHAEAHVDVQAHYDHSRAVSKGTADAVSTAKTLTDTIGKMTSATQNKGINLGVNFGVNFSRSSNVSVTIGKNEGLTQKFTNHGIQYTLDTIEKQIKRLEESSALGMWDFSAYFLSKSPVIANNAAHMYLALTQGDESYLSQSSVNLWVPPTNAMSKDEKRNEEIRQKRQNVKYIVEYIKRLQHPEFQLQAPENDNEWLMYPPHVSTTVSLTGRELARSLNFPKKSISGVPVIECAAFGREVHQYEVNDNPPEEIGVGYAYHMHHDEKEKVMLDINSLTSHTFVTGSTGTGKSNTVYQLISKIRDKGINFMVIEPAKGEYKEWLGADCHVYGTNSNETELLYINPFSFPEEIHVLEHIDRLVEILNACWPMYAAMPAVLKDAIERIYVNKGWNLQKNKCCIKGGREFPTFVDLLSALPEVMEESAYSNDTKSDYSGALMTRVKSLTNGLNGQLLCSGVERSSADLFESNVIVDLSRIGSMETRAFFMGILVMKLQEYHMSKKEMNVKLKHLTVLEEAHNLLRKTSTAQSQESSNLQGKSVEMLTNSIAEMRTYGESFIIVDQAPGLLDEAVIRNTNTKIILRLPDADDREVVGKSAALDDNQIDEIAKLTRGVAVVYQNNWVEAVLCHFEKYDDKRPYSKVEDAVSTPYDIFCKGVFIENGFKALKSEDVDSVLAWIENSKYARETKRIMKKALVEGVLTEREKQLIAYNVFEGKAVAKLLSGALTEEEGIEKADYFIRNNCELNDDDIVRSVRQMIIQVIVSSNNESDLAKRYVEYSVKIK